MEEKKLLLENGNYKNYNRSKQLQLERKEGSFCPVAEVPEGSELNGLSEVKTVKEENESSMNVWAVEIMFLMFKIAESILEPTVKQHIYRIVCLNINQLSNNETVSCENIHLNLNLEHEVQERSAHLFPFYKILINCPAILVVLCCGAWSDKFGRTTPIILTSLGTALAALTYMGSISGDFQVKPSIPLFLLGAGIRGAFGRSAIMTMAVNSFVSDNSHHHSRTSRLSNLAAMSHFGYLIGSSVAGFLLERLGFSLVFLIVIVMDTACVLTAFSCMKEKRGRFDRILHAEMKDDDIMEERRNKKNERKISENEKKKKFRGRRCHTISTSEDFIVIQMPSGKNRNTTRKHENILSKNVHSLEIPNTPSNPLETSIAERQMWHKASTPLFPSISTREKTNEKNKKSHERCQIIKFMTRERGRRERISMVILFLIIYLNQMNKSGESDLYFLFTKRSPLNITSSTYGYLLSANYAFMGLFAFFVPKVMSCCGLHLGDTSLSILGVLFKISSLVILFFSRNLSLLVATAVVAGPNSLTVSTVKSMVSKIAHPDEIGITFSLMSSGETLSNMLGGLLYPSIYSLSSHFCPGLGFLVEIGVYGLVLVLLFGLKISKRKKLGVKGQEEEVEEEEEELLKSDDYENYDEEDEEEEEEEKEMPSDVMNNGFLATNNQTPRGSGEETKTESPTISSCS